MRVCYEFTYFILLIRRGLNTDPPHIGRGQVTTRLWLQSTHEIKYFVRQSTRFLAGKLKSKHIYSLFV